MSETTIKAEPADLNQPAFKQPARAKSAKKANFLLLAGDHSEGDTRYEFSPSRQTVVASDKPLDEMFGATKFRRLSDGEAPVPEATTAAALEEAEAPSGEDVTAQFDGAEAADVVVFKDGREYKVYEKGDTTTPLHSERFSSKAQVAEYIDTIGGE